MNVHASSPALSTLRGSHLALKNTMIQVDELMVKAHQLGSCKKMAASDLNRFSNLLADMASSLQEWVQFFEEAVEEEPSASRALQEEEEEEEEEKEVPGGDIGQESVHSSPVGSQPWLNVNDEATAMAEQTSLSDSPLVPWLESVQFFMLTPIPRQQNLATFANLQQNACENDDLRQNACAKDDGENKERIMEQEIEAGSSPETQIRSETPTAMDMATPLPPPSLMKRYAQFFVAPEPASSSPMAISPMFETSPPKTCIVMKPQQARNAETLYQEPTFDTPMLLKSPFRTPGLFLFPPGHADQAVSQSKFASVRKSELPPKPPESFWRTPSSEMPISTIRKPGLPRPGEQTLKRELWCRFEAEFVNMGDICKSLFPETQTDPSKASRDGQSTKDAEKTGRFQMPFVPRRLQHMASNLV